MNPDQIRVKVWRDDLLIEIGSRLGGSGLRWERDCSRQVLPIARFSSRKEMARGRNALNGQSSPHRRVYSG